MTATAPERNANSARDARSPEDEEALRAEWQVLENRVHMVIAAPVEGESD